jgi:hypothetical protein
MKRLKTTTTLILLFTLTLNAQSQDSDTTAWYDFWVGDWNLTWDDGQGNSGKGTNHVVKILDSNVIQENFEGIDGLYKGTKGMSLSVYSPATKTWHQAWADNQGGYFDLTGEVDAKRKIFKTKMTERNGKKIQARMVFHQFRDDGFTWDWESTQDGGETWTNNWQIIYTKSKK